MNPTENFNVPRRALDVEDYIDVLRRHRGWIFGPFLLTVVASVVGVYLWPDSYESQAVIQIIPQQIPQNMVQSAVNQDRTDRINSLKTAILSARVMATMITNLNLYPRERGRMPIEDVIELMSRKVQVTPAAVAPGGRLVPAFYVRFTYENRKKAQDVVAEL